jgi:hypothetical protein
MASILSGSATTATISNSGTISVEGNNSGGIVVDSDLTGSITNTGTITVKGDNAVGVGVGNVTGNLNIGGTVAVIGSGAQAVVVDGNVTGTVKIDGAMSQAVSYTPTMHHPDALAHRAQHRQGRRAGFGQRDRRRDRHVASSSNSTTETTGSIQSYGTSPALLRRHRQHHDRLGHGHHRHLFGGDRRHRGRFGLLQRPQCL